ncbi:MAG: hypothetical protein AB8G05_00925 [Oligoflexales bacterium]
MNLEMKFDKGFESKQSNIESYARTLFARQIIKYEKIPAKFKVTMYQGADLVFAKVKISNTKKGGKVISIFRGSDFVGCLEQIRLNFKQLIRMFLRTTHSEHNLSTLRLIPQACTEVHKKDENRYFWEEDKVQSLPDGA